MRLNPIKRGKGNPLGVIFTMATIYNSEVSKQLAKAAGIQQAVDKIPSELIDKISPVMEVNPNLLRRSDIEYRQTRTSSGTSNLFVVPSSKVFVCTNIYLGYVKDAASDAGSVAITLKSGDGSTQTIRPAILTLTAQEGNIIIPFSRGLIIPEGSTLSVGYSSTAGNCVLECTVFGYYENIGA